MTHAEKKEISKISQSFAKGFKDMFGGINGSEWCIVDPLSGYLNSCGFKNKLEQMPEKDGMPQVLLMTFEDGSMFIPAGGDLAPVDKKFKNWMWL